MAILEEPGYLKFAAIAAGCVLLIMIVSVAAYRFHDPRIAVWKKRLALVGAMLGVVFIALGFDQIGVGIMFLSAAYLALGFGGHGGGANVGDLGDGGDGGA